MKFIKPNISPRHVPLREAQHNPHIEPLPLIDLPHCDGQFCKLKDRVIPPGMQTYKVMGKTFCRLCLVALNGTDRHLFDDNAMFINGLNPSTKA